MNFFPLSFKKNKKKFLGIDIGTCSVRVIELGRKGKEIVLENYGELKSSSIQALSFRAIEENGLLFSSQDTAKAISIILKNAAIETKEANFSIPDFTTFFTSFELPSMTEKELPQAVQYQVRSNIPLPLSEVTIDWLVIEGSVNQNSKGLLKVMVAAIPNDIIFQYQEIARLANLEIKSLEAEAFALCRAVNYNNNKTISIIDVGARTTTINIAENGILKMSHSFNVGGNELTEALSQSLKISYEQAEELKKEAGFGESENNEKKVQDVLFPLVNLIFSEINKIHQSFYYSFNKKVEKIFLAGGIALMPGLKDYFAKELGLPVDIIDPFANISYNPILKDILQEMGPIYAIAVGLAKKGLE